MFDKKELNKYGFDFESLDDIMYYIRSQLEWLKWNNRNYTPDQKRKIDVLDEIVNCYKGGCKNENE